MGTTFIVSAIVLGAFVSAATANEADQFAGRTTADLQTELDVRVRAQVQQELTDLKLCNEWAAAMEGIVIPGVEPFPWPRKRECMRRLGYKAEVQ